MKTRIITWMKFNMVGFFGFTVQMTVVTLLKTGLGLHYLLATVLAVESAVLHNFVWHERWTWRHRKLGMSGVLARLGRYNAANGLISLTANGALAWVLVEKFHFHYLLANVTSISACALVNFFVSDRLVFRSIHAK